MHLYACLCATKYYLLLTCRKSLNIWAWSRRCKYVVREISTFHRFLRIVEGSTPAAIKWLCMVMCTGTSKCPVRGFGADKQLQATSKNITAHLYYIIKLNCFVALHAFANFVCVICTIQFLSSLHSPTLLTIYDQFCIQKDTFCELINLQGVATMVVGDIALIL